VTPFWYAIVALCVVAALVNGALAFARRKHALAAAMRGVAALLSIGLAAGIVLGKAIAMAHPYLTKENVFIGIGVFIAVVFLLPSYVEKQAGDAPKVTLQQRAARPTNATIRLRDAKGADEWVN
jgi:hypothetical protein